MAIMKVWDGKRTVYLFHPEDLVEIADVGEQGVALVLPVTLGRSPRIHYIKTTKTARDIKREIQENTNEEIGYLKINADYVGPWARRYINAKYIHDLTPWVNKRNVDGKEVEVEDSTISLEHKDSYDDRHVGLRMPPFDVARQIRRILLRLEQDEDICCVPPAEEETE